MKSNRLLAVLVPAVTVLTLLAVSLPGCVQKTESWQVLARRTQKAQKWQIVVSKSLMEDEAIKVVLDDLEKTGKEFGIIFEVVDDGAQSLNNVIVVGDPARSKAAAALVKQGKIKLEGVSDEQGYEIRTITTDGGRTIIVAGGSLIGDVYGLYWIWDRMRVLKEIPEINVKKVPALKIRVARHIGNNVEDMRRALRYGVNWMLGENVLNLVPWQAEPEGTENQKNREKTKELIRYAHSLHMKYIAFGTDFTYHPSLLEEFGATLSPCDPAFWDVLQAKYRRLLQLMPELDGIGTFTSEEQYFWGNYKTFDVMHDGEGCDWGLEKRYRTFVKKIHNVVVGEFDKILYHTTWVTNPYEQHSQPDIFRKIFSQDVPVRNLYLSPSLNQCDRWWFKAYNPTFNLTPHNMIVVFEAMDYHETGSSNIFPTFPGQYFQAGLKTMLDVDNSNLKGASLDLTPAKGWNTRYVTVYTISRLEWDYNEDVRKIAEDFASIYFDKAVAKEMAEIYLLSPTAYKYGLYIEPVVYGGFTSLPHIRVGIFPAQGYPSIDNGREHIEFLRKIYLRCEPWIPETLNYLDHGLQTSNRMCQIFQQVKPLVKDSKLAQDVENTLELTRLLIRTNNLYVKTFFAYFGYRGNPTVENKNKLSNLFNELKNTRKRFVEAPGFGYKLFGVEQLLKNVEQILENLQKAEQTLAKAPSKAEIERTVADQQDRYVSVLEEHSKDAVKFLHFEGRVDGRDILKIKRSNIEIEHLRWDGMYLKDHSFLDALPEKVVTVVPRDIQSRPIHPFILEQPTEENDYTVKVYLYDVPGGAGWFKFDLYYIPKSPEELGLKIPWVK